MYYEALELAMSVHANQTRWDGSMYIEHPKRVSYRVTGDKLKTIAVLHDTVEDGANPQTIEKHIRSQFGNTVGDAVMALTRMKDESYSDFIVRAGQNTLARTVKIADIEDNLHDIPTNVEARRKAGNLQERYLKALKYLRELK